MPQGVRGDRLGPESIENVQLIQECMGNTKMYGNFSKGHCCETSIGSQKEMYRCRRMYRVGVVPPV